MNSFKYLGIDIYLSDFKVKHWLFHENEFWKPILGYELYYSISNLGRVKTLVRRKGSNKLDFILKPNKTGNTYKTNPYHSIVLCKPGIKKKTFIIHRLVATAFIPNPTNLPIINHKKAIKNINRHCNLEWSTQLQNIHHSNNLGLRSTPTNAKILLDLQTGIFYKSIFEASKSKGINYNTLMARLSPNHKLINNTNLVYA